MYTMLRTCIFMFLAASIAIMTSCSKTEDPIPTVGSPIPYVASPATKKITEVLASLSNISFYNAAWNRTDMRQYMDSLRSKDSSKSFSLFVPTDKAMLAAGYTLDKINHMPVQDLDSLLRYLAIDTRINYDSGTAPQGTTTYYTLNYPDPNLYTPGYPSNPYLYKISVGAFNNQIYINGRKASGIANATPAKEGCIFLIDTLITRPTLTLHDILSSDTTYSLYMSALRISDSVYNTGIGGGFGYPFDDSSYLYLSSNYERGKDGWAIIFAPINDAFRKIGIYNDEDLSNYIAQSAVFELYPQTGLPILTNMDSILANHRMLFNVSSANVRNTSMLYTMDMLYNPYMRSFSNGTDFWNVGGLEGAITISNIGGTAVLHRQDIPNGRAATVISPHDITTLNGVLHTVDNLLLPIQ